MLFRSPQHSGHGPVLGPVRNGAAQQEVSGGPASEASSAAQMSDRKTQTSRVRQEVAKRINKIIVQNLTHEDKRELQWGMSRNIRKGGT